MTIVLQLRVVTFFVSLLDIKVAGICKNYTCTRHASQSPKLPLWLRKFISVGFAGRGRHPHWDDSHSLNVQSGDIYEEC